MFARGPEHVRLAGTAMAEHSLGHDDASKAALATLQKKYSTSAATTVAQVHAWRGENDLAFTWLERATERRDREATTVRLDPILARLKNDPRYPALLHELGLPSD